MNEPILEYPREDKIITRKLSPTMERALAKVDNEWRCSVKLKERYTTMNALFERGLVERCWEGSYYYPRPENAVGYKFRLPQTAEYLRTHYTLYWEFKGTKGGGK